MKRLLPRGLLPNSMAGQLITVALVAVAVGNLLLMLLIVATHPDFPRETILRIPILAVLSALPALLLLISWYVMRWIARPLSVLADAARSFGHSPGDEHPVPESGPREIVSLTHTFNGMRREIRELVDTRTRMLVSIGHDLRTPLTRLRLWSEAVGDAQLAERMQREIGRVDSMLGDTLAYLRGDTHSEQSEPADLASILQTICAEFTDVGCQVRYRGPDRFAYPCRPVALMRAVTNLVDNAVRFAAHVEVVLAAGPETVVIVVSDDGPGVPVELRTRVFEAASPADGARPLGERGGFGLGLSIAYRIAQDHGGAIVLEESAQGGLAAKVQLPATVTEA